MKPRIYNPNDLDAVDEYIREGRLRQARWNRVTSVFKGLGAGILVLVVVVLFVIQYNGCQTNTDQALNALRSEGLTNPTLGGPTPGKCADNETSRSFSAVNAQGEYVTGVVCCGLVVKSCTIRW